jgi:hypothetical protein
MFVLKENKEKISGIKIKTDDRLIMINNGQIIKTITKDEL